MTAEKTPKFVFGPVPSRRLGRSLGVDLVPFKTCTFDCIYCQLGRTTIKTTRRKPYVDLGEVLSELEARLPQVKADFITLSGSGEPTLHSELGEVVTRIKKLTTTPVAILTNGSLLSEAEVRSACMQADVVLPSLDAAVPSVFNEINRPCREITFGRLWDGLMTFRREYAGLLWLEVFLVRGVNDSRAHLMPMKDLLHRLQPDRVQLNTVIRPPAEIRAQRVPAEQMREIQDYLGHAAEVLCDPSPSAGEAAGHVGRQDVLALLRRRPCTLSDIAAGLAIHVGEAAKLAQALAAEGLIIARDADGRQYYMTTV